MLLFVFSTFDTFHGLGSFDGEVRFLILISSHHFNNFDASCQTFVRVYVCGNCECVYRYIHAVGRYEHRTEDSFTLYIKTLR